MSELPTFAEIEAAATALKPVVVRTPLVRSPLLDERLDARIFFKAECLQHTGSFKFRGAYNAIRNLPVSAKETGIFACSSGNHAQGIAEAARLHEIPATIIMPSDAPAAKKDRTRRSGATIIDYDRYSEDREAVTEALAAEHGAPVIHPYENLDVIRGQGTCGLEIAEGLQELGIEPDHVLVCAGGGGLMAGVLLAVSHHFPQVQVHPCEPEGYDDQARSHSVGKRVGGNSTKPSVCDAIVSPMPGENSFAICKGRLGEGLVVSDNEALAAVAFAFREMKLVVEPGGAVTLAALLSGKMDVRGKVVVCTLSGGNIDETMLQRALAL